ncbi:hypothetical protein C8A03DRAFT_38456 [Achaetomium macrosporum]|uniref:Uncharacterized protein n=1 Tax=Achaetomium macrosporum TaxID=79813 RepID=A0AAN7H7F4_9PEZI|nr:hypothetical protein C8A03DRAFT_38456 [Achaetomium macrosporum]
MSRTEHYKALADIAHEPKTQNTLVHLVYSSKMIESAGNALDITASLNDRVSRIILNILLLRYAGHVSEIGLNHEERDEYIRIVTRASKLFHSEDMEVDFHNHSGHFDLASFVLDVCSLDRRLRPTSGDEPGFGRISLPSPGAGGSSHNASGLSSPRASVPDLSSTPSDGARSIADVL